MHRRTAQLAVSVVLASLPCAAPALAGGPPAAKAETELGKLAATLKPGEMKELKTTGYTRDLLKSWYDWEWEGVTAARSKYGGQKMFNIMTGGWANDGKWDPVTRQVLYCGIGHYASMKFVTYSADRNEWTLMPVPPPLDPRNEDAIQCGIENGRRVWSRGHTYDLQAISPKHRMFVLLWSRGLNVYDIDKKEWSLVRGDFSYQGAADQIEYFPELAGFVHTKRPKVMLYDPVAGKNRELGAVSGIALHCVMEYSPVYKVLVFGGGTPAGSLWRLDAGGRLQKLKPAPGCVACVATAKFTCDPASGEYVVVTEKTEKAASKTYAFHPLKDEWKEMPDKRFPTGVAVPVNTFGVIMICTGSQVYLYKHKPLFPAGGTPRKAAAPGTRIRVRTGQ
jgi:hypothetical protein